MSFLRNVWYMAAWSDEVGVQLLSRRLLGEPMLLYRRTDGRAVALVDRCPHRFAPLSLGTRQGDDIQCGYHGLTFNSSGTCIRNPFASTIPKGATVQAFPTRERDGIVWFWAGDPTAAAEAPVPDFSQVVDPTGGPPLHGYTAMSANYEYGTDNLMDLSHIEFVHRGSFAGAGVIFAGSHTATEEGPVIRSNWWMPDVAAPAHTFGVYPRELRTDHWLDMRWEAPATMFLEIGATPCGSPRSSGVIVRQAHILTPASEDSTHYFWSSTRTTPTATEEGDAALLGLFQQAFGTEDKPMIEAAFRNTIGKDFWDRKPVFLGIDAGGLRARRALQRLIAQECAG